LRSIIIVFYNRLLNYLGKEGKYFLDAITPENSMQREITLKIAQLYSKVSFYLNVHAD